MKKNVKIAKQLLKIAKSLVAANPYETKIVPERLIRVWQGKNDELIERVLLIVKLREAIAANSATISRLKNDILNKFTAFGDSTKHINKILERLENNPDLTHNFDYTLTKPENKKMPNPYPIIDNNNSYMQVLQNGFMEELHKIDQAIQLMAYVASGQLSPSQYLVVTGLDKATFDSLVNGLAPDFISEMDNNGFDVQMLHQQRGSTKNIDDFELQKLEEFIQNNIKDKKIRLDAAIGRLELGTKNSRMIIQKLHKKDKYLSEVLATTSFANANNDRDLGNLFKKQHGVFIPSNSVTGSKTAGFMDGVKNLFNKFVSGVSNTWAKIKELFDNKQQLDTTENSEAIINAFGNI